MRKFLLLVFTLFSIVCFGQGNMITISSTVPSQLTVCAQSKQFTITIYNPSPFTLSSDTLKISLPQGIFYQAGTITGATEANISVLNQPVFTLADIPTLNTVHITFKAAATCDVLPFLAGGGIIQNTIRLNYFANGTSTYDSQTTSSYIVRHANLSISAVTNQSYSGSIGDNFTRCITVSNGGLGELSQFTFIDVHGSGITINAATPGNWSTSGTTETIVFDSTQFKTIGDHDTLFENGESITFCETVHIINCISVSSAFEAYWGCNSQHCQSSTSNANVVFPNLIPNLVLTPIASMNTCLGSGNASLEQLKIVNTGLGKATNVMLDVFQTGGAGSGYQTNLGSYFDTASFTIQTGTNGTPVPITFTGTYATSALSCMTNPRGRVTFTIPQINAGDTIYIKWNTYSCCYNDCVNFGSYDINGWRFKGTYQNICQSTYLIAETWGRQYSRLRAGLVNNGSPSTMISGQTGTFDFLFSFYENNYPVGPGAYWKFEFTLPPCLVYSGGLQILRANGINTWIPNSVTTAGDTVTAIFNGTPPWSLLQAQVMLNLTVDCSTCGGSHSGAVTVKAEYIPNNTCTCAVTPTCQSTSINILCPDPCPQGMVFNYFQMPRTSYGLPDNEPGGGNGVPDLSGSLDFTKIKTDRAMFGDTITATFNGTVRTSLSYPSWQYCFATSSMSNGNRLSFLNSVLTIYRGGTVLLTCNNITPTITNSGSTRTFKYNLSVPALTPCLNGFTYQDGDSVIFQPKYKVTSNIGGATPLNCYSTNEYYMSDIANPTLPANKFQCRDFNGSCNIVGYYFTNYASDSYIVKSCDNITIGQSYYLSIGPCCNNYGGGNMFPYEYRNWAHIDTLTARLPYGYDFISAQFNLVRTAGTLLTNTSSWIPLTPLNTNSDTLKFPVEQYFIGYGGSSLVPSDDGFHGTLQITLRPSCKVTPVSRLPIFYDWTFGPSSYLTGPGSAATAITQNNDTIAYDAPNLFLQSTLPSINAPDMLASWDISISNTSNTSNALNTWLSGPSFSGVTITQVKDLDNNVIINPVGTIYQIGAVNATAVRNFRITASYTSCAKDSIIVYAGWNCNAGYPSSVNTYPCTPKTIKLTLTPLMPALVTNITAPSGTVHLCDTASYTIEGINVQLGTSYNNTLTAILPLGVDIVSGSSQMSYPETNPYVTISDPVFMGGTTWQWDISAIDSTIGADGLKGILQTTLNKFKVTFKVVTNCGYTSGSSIAFNLLGKAACGQPTGQEVELSSQLGITGATIPYTSSVRLATTYISPCAANSTMLVSVRNQGPLAFGSTDSITVQLPPSVTLVNGSFVGIHNSPLNGVPVQYTLNNSQYLVWKLPPGVVAGDSTVFSFDYKGDPTTLDCNIQYFYSKTTSSTVVVCTNTGTNCGINLTTGDTTLAVFVYKAYLALSNGQTISVPNPPTGETVTISFDINNTGQAILSGASSIVQFYFDSNGNGIYDPSDVFLTQDTLLISNNSTVHYTKTFNVAAGQACSIIATVRDVVNPCVCNPSHLTLALDLKSLGNDTTVCSGQSVALGKPPVTGYTYSWSPTTNLSSGVIANPVLNASNVTALPLSINYILSTTRLGCVTKDTIQITTNPLPIANAGTDTTVCPTSATHTLGTPFITGYTYNWSPSTGLNNTTIANPIASLSVAGTTTYTLTVTALGCSSKDSAVIKVNPLPTATTTGSTAVCKNGVPPNITFTGANGTAPYTFTYKINGGSNQTVSTTSGNSVTVAAPTSTVGTFIYTLISVHDASSTTCSQLQSGSDTVIVNPLPTATISGTAQVCNNASLPTLTFVGANGTAPYTFTYKINGGANQTVISTGDTAIVMAPTSVVGTFVYSLVSVQDSSTTACTQSQSGSATITVNPLPTATISGSTTVCQNDLPPHVTFTAANGTAPFTFTYTVNSGVNQTVTTSSGNTVSINAPTNVSGNFVYNLLSVEDSSASTCQNTQTGTVTVVVNPLPTALIKGDTTVCKGSASPTITFVGANSTAPYTFTYALNGVTQPTVTTSGGDSVSVVVPTNTVGSYIYSLISVKDASATACQQLQADTAIVKINPLPTATILGSTTICQNDSAPTILFVGASGTAPYTFTYSLNSGPNQTIVSTNGDTAKLLVPTAVSGTFTYSLLSVSDGSVTACSQLQNGSATVIIHPLPTATITGNITVCENAPAPSIVFTGANGVAPYTFVYSINGAVQAPIVTTIGSSVSISAPTNTVDTLVYKLISVQESSSTNCLQQQSDSVLIIIHPLPDATIMGTTVVCQDDTAPTITFTGTNGSAPYIFTYKINGGSNQTVTSSPDSIAIIQASTLVAGTFTYNLVGVQESSIAGCFQAINDSAVIKVNPLPMAAISGTASVCQNANAPAVTFSGSNGTAPYTFTYAINNITQPPVLSIGDTISITVPTAVAGTFVYSLISVMDSSSTACVNAVSGNAIVTVNPLPMATIAGSSSVCKSAPSPQITFTGSNGTAPYTIIYQVNGGAAQSVITSGNTATVNVPTSVVDTLVYSLISITDNSTTLCTQMQHDSAVVIINPLPLVNFTAQDVCYLQPMSFIDASTVDSGTVVTWLWNFSDNNSLSSSQNPTYVFSSAGTYLVMLTATSDKGCTDSAVRPVVVHPLPNPNFYAANVCDKDTMYFTDLTTIPMQDTLETWNWSFGDNTNHSFNKDTSHQFATFGTYMVKLVVQSRFGCVDSISKPVVVNPKPIVNFIAHDTVGCEPLCVGFQDSSSIYPGANVHWLWDVGDGTTSSNGQIFEHCYTNDSVYAPILSSVTLTVTSDSGCVSALTKNNYITVYPLPLAAFGVTPQITTIEDPVITVSDSSIGSNFWHWDFADNFIDTAHNPKPHVYADTGTYNILLITTTQYGCVDSAYQTVYIRPDFAFYVPNAFTPDGDGINDTFNGKGIYIKEYEMMIFDRWGNLIYQTQDYYRPWDGRANGGAEMAQRDVYVYVIKLTDIFSNQHKYRGTVTLVR